MGVERFFTESSKKWGGVVDRTLEVTNRLGGAGEFIVANHKPIGFGLAAAIGISAVLSEPPPSLPGGVPRATPNMRSGSGGEHMQPNLHPDGGIEGAPTVEPMVNAGNTARVAAPGYRVNVRASSPGNVNYNQVGSQVQSAVGGGMLTTNVRDNRSSLTPQQIADMMTRG